MSNAPDNRRKDLSRPAAPRPPASTPRGRDDGAPARPVTPKARSVPGTAASSAPARPARPAAPNKPATGQRLEGVLEEGNKAIQSIESVLPSGLSTSTYLPHARRDPETLRRLQVRRRYDLRQTVLPTVLVLSISMVAMAGGWFLLDPSSALRDNAMGASIPLTLLILGIGFALIAALLMVQTASLRKELAADAEN
jgi:hypothetical protein